ncbi:MAG: hypothetical protein ACIAXF_01535 [Phycisphaerales bacterium JB063]
MLLVQPEHEVFDANDGSTTLFYGFPGPLLFQLAIATNAIL